MKRAILVLALTWSAAAATGAQMAPGRMELSEFRKLHEAKKVLVVDVRDEQSFAAGHIPGAINIRLGDEEQRAHRDRLKAEKRTIVTYCA